MVCVYDLSNITTHYKQCRYKPWSPHAAASPPPGPQAAYPAAASPLYSPPEITGCNGPRWTLQAGSNVGIEIKI